MSRCRFLWLAATVLLALVIPTRAEAVNVTLAWDAPVDPTVTGYVVSYGIVSRAYGQEINVGNVTQYTVTALALNQTYYFAVQSYNATGVRSAFSAEVVFQPLAITCHVTNAVSTTGNPVAVTLVPPDVIGATGTATTTCTPPSGSLFPVGTTALNCSATDSTGTASCQSQVVVTYVPPVVATVTIAPNPVAGTVGTGQGVTGQALDATNTPIAGVTLTWSVANVAVATLSNNTATTATVTGVAAGSTTLTATAPNGVSQTVTVTMAVATVTIAPNQINVGQTVTASVSNGPGNTGDWVGLYFATDPDSTVVDWKYLSGSQTRPGSGLTSASVLFTPTVPGTYNVRFFQNDSTTKLATSATLTVKRSRRGGR